MTSPSMYYFTNTLKGAFIDATTSDEPQIGFSDVVNMDDVWRYLLDPFPASLYNSWYIDNATAEDVDLFVLNENRILGLPRLRQVKVRNDSCTVHSDFKEEIKFCFSSFAPGVEDKDPFGKYITHNETNNTAWFYQTESDLKGSTVQGLVNSYGGGGFVALLANNSEQTEDIIQDLKDHLWITRGTRAIFLDFTLYNANLNLFCQVRLTFEFPATGGVVSSSMFRTSKLIRYVNNFDYFIMVCEIFLIIYIVYYTIEEILELRQQGKALYSSLWNLIDLIIILIAYVCIIFNVYRNNKVNELLDSLLMDEQQYPDFEFLGYWQMQFNNTIAGATFISWMKIFKYTSFNKTMTQLTTTISRCAKDVAGFAVMFFIIFLAYAQLGYLIFGTQVYDFSSFAQSIYTLFRTILGDFDYEAIQRAQRILGPIYFLSYIFFVFFVLLNMFLAIINDTYAEVKGEIVESEIKLTTFLKKGCSRIMDKFNLKHEKIVDIQHALVKGDLNNDKLIDFDEFRNNLRVSSRA
jgi:polycystin 2